MRMCDVAWVADYDQTHDVLYVSQGPPRSGYGQEDDEFDNLIIRYDHNGFFMGFTIWNFKQSELFWVDMQARIPGDVDLWGILKGVSR